MASLCSICCRPSESLWGQISHRLRLFDSSCNTDSSCIDFCSCWVCFCCCCCFHVSQALVILLFKAFRSSSPSIRAWFTCRYFSFRRQLSLPVVFPNHGKQRCAPKTNLMVMNRAGLCHPPLSPGPCRRQPSCSCRLPAFLCSRMGGLLEVFCVSVAVAVLKLGVRCPTEFQE